MLCSADPTRQSSKASISILTRSTGQIRTCKITLSDFHNYIKTHIQSFIIDRLSKVICKSLSPKIHPHVLLKKFQSLTGFHLDDQIKQKH